LPCAAPIGKYNFEQFNIAKKAKGGKEENEKKVRTTGLQG
jgi:hypothetical protein